MRIEEFHKKLLASDDFAMCSLRATFFVRHLRTLRLFEAIQEVNRLAKVSKGFVWTNHKSLGIEDDAWKRINDSGINPLLFFCHPRVLSEQPRLLLYYRTLALISQKGLSALTRSNLATIEAGKAEKLNADCLKQLCVAINSILSAIVRTAAEIDAQHFPGFQFATAGTTIQGSWNNAIGTEGEHAVKTILVNNLRGEIAQVVWRDGSTMEYKPRQHTVLIDSIGNARVVRLKEGFHLLFSSEPDVSLRNPEDLPVVAVEVKAGGDPAGALERLGAAMKSFENDRNLNPRVKTVYVVRCITPELQRRISQNNPFDHTFSLAELLADDKTQKTFANLMLRVILKSKS